MSIFISHSSKDADVALKICEILEKNGKECFIAPRDIRMGKEYAEEIVNGIDYAEAMVLLMSEHANKSPHVLREVERAVSKSIPILVYALEKVELSKSMEYFLMSHQWMNVEPGGDYAEIIKYVCDLKQKSGATQTEAVPVVSTVSSAPNKLRNIFAITLCMIFVAVVAACGGYYFAKNDSKQEIVKKDIQIGDTVTFGNYNGEPISWRVLKINENNEEAVLISKDILTMKAFDAAESGKFNYNGDEDYWKESSQADTDMELQALVRGNSDWSISNIRTWLNSSEEVVKYADQPPKVSAMAEHKNGYENEAGFLYGFTEEELSAIREQEVITKGNALSEKNEVVTMDRVYLLSLDELKWFEEAGISILATPTQAAVEQDKSNWYAVDFSEYGIKEYCWWLREPVEGMASKCYMVGNGYYEENLRQENVGLEGFGVRPALTVDLSSDLF